MTWRYQPVWTMDCLGKHYSMARIDVDAGGALLNWVQDEAPELWAMSMQELRDELARMLMDANLYKPVALSALKVGTVFERVAG